MKISVNKLKDLLVLPGHIKAEDFDQAKKEAIKANEDLADVLINKNLIKDEELGQLIAQDMDFDFVNLREEKIDEKLINLIPEIVARQQGIIVFFQDKEKVKVGMVSPHDRETVHILEKRLGQEVKPYFVTKRDLGKALFHYKKSLVEEIESTVKNLNKPPGSEEGGDMKAVRIVDLLLGHALDNHASDIHIEPGRDAVAVRFRIDSVMHKIASLPKGVLEPILMRIKILSKMRIDEHLAAQDGKFQYQIGDDRIDIRVSIVPTTGGENVVMRLLSAKVRQLSLKNLGLIKKDLKRIEQVIKSPQGMILSTGPTGCGKTTTLYAVLQVLNTPEVHISTIEDPVEYDIAGISQIQVNSKTNLSFAQGLRALVRQDPDIIMVGEIRDKETAGIAVNSAMTGHLVLTTMHANDAATTLPRLLNMRVEPYLAASTVNIIIGQRLVRKICAKCLISYQLSPEEIEIINANQGLKEIFKARGKEDLGEIRMYKGEGCKICANTGYVGRIGVFEVMEISEKIKELIISRASSHEIVKAAKTEGMATMTEDGLDKAFKGITTLQEILRVTSA